MQLKGLQSQSLMLYLCTVRRDCSKRFGQTRIALTADSQVWSGFWFRRPTTLDRKSALMPLGPGSDPALHQRKLTQCSC